MGGYGAAHLGFKYPDLFGIVGVMAGALITPRDSVQPAVFQKMFGSDPAYVQANDPFALARKNADVIRGKTTVRIAVGDQDSLQVRNQALHELLGQLKIEHEYEVVPGVAHNSNLFYDALGERAFAWYRKPLAFQTPPPEPVANASAPSHLFKRGDLEILTYETEQDYDRLQELFEQSRKSPATPGTMTTRYYRSNMDSSVQPYALRLPRDYTRDRKYPLVIQLHGTNFHEVLSGARLRYRGMGGPQWIEPDLPVIYVDNFGRPTTFYQGMGEVDILEMIEEVKRQFSVDPDRIFIMGHSMGGAGSYTVGLHHPDLFGGILAVDPAMWSKEPPSEDLPEWMKPQIAISAVPKLYPNARNVDVFFKNAGAGLQGRSTEFNDGIVAQGGFSTSESFPGMPHSFGNLYSDAAFVTELIQHPVRRHPAEVKFYTNSLQWNQAYWVTVDRLTRHNADASVTATYKEGSLRVKTTNLDALTLRLADTPAPKGSSTTLIVDGEEVHSGPLPEVAHLSKETGKWKIGEWSSSERSKRHGLQGPIGDAFNSRFLAVYGEGDRELAIAELDAVRNPPGPLDIHADFPMKPAAKVTREDIASSNLILFGTPQSNPVLRRIAQSLPSGLMRPGAIFIYPNPENPARYVLVWSTKLLSIPEPGVRPASWARGGLGLSAGWIMPLNLLPDYVQVESGKIISGGHFDNEWKTPLSAVTSF
jgi:enterochelin esterase-like enzyme